VGSIELSTRQKKIIEIIKENEPITSEHLAEKMNITRSTLRTDLALLSMIGALDAKPKVGYYCTGNSILEVTAEKIKKIRVSEVISVPIVIDEQTTIYDAIVTLFLEDTGTLFVLSNEYLAGVVSRKDLLKSLMGGTDMNKVPVGMVMTRMPNIVTINEEETAVEAANRIIEHEVDCLPVVKELYAEGKKHYKIIGKISKTNITRLFVELVTNQI